MSKAALIRALRTRLGMSQVRLAELATSGGYPMAREEVSKLERGSNRATSARTVGALAAAAGVAMGEMQKYLEGQTSLDALLEQNVAVEK